MKTSKYITEWDPYLKYPYTRLRDMGFSPLVQIMTKDDANALLAHVAVAAINSGQSTAAVTAQVLAGGPQDPLLTARQTRKTRGSAMEAAEPLVVGRGKESESEEGPSSR